MNCTILELPLFIKKPYISFGAGLSLNCTILELPLKAGGLFTDKFNNFELYYIRIATINIFFVMQMVYALNCTILELPHLITHS